MDTEVLEKKIEALEHAQAESTMKPDLERRFLEVLCRDYTAVYHVGLKDDFVEPLTVSSVANAAKIPQMLQKIRSSYTEIIRLYCDKYVAPANSKEFLRVMQRESLLEELSKRAGLFTDTRVCRMQPGSVSLRCRLCALTRRSLTVMSYWRFII